MGKRHQRSAEDAPSASSQQDNNNNNKRLKITTTTTTITNQQTHDDDDRPTSRKALRAQRKAAARQSLLLDETEQQQQQQRKLQAQQQQQQQDKREQIRQAIRQARQEKKLRRKQQQQEQQQQQQHQKKQKKKKSPPLSCNVDKEQDMVSRLVQEIKHGRIDNTSGWTTLAMGVQYKDLIVASKKQQQQGGVVVTSRSLVTVKYRLSAVAPPKSGIVLDSNNKFTFRVGKGEVIHGFDAAVRGMQLGGRRLVIVPPKAGYGSQDIGAGPGAVLQFDITVVAVREA